MNDWEIKARRVLLCHLKALEDEGYDEERAEAEGLVQTAQLIRDTKELLGMTVRPTLKKLAVELAGLPGLATKAQRTQAVADAIDRTTAINIPGRNENAQVDLLAILQRLSSRTYAPTGENMLDVFARSVKP